MGCVGGLQDFRVSPSLLGTNRVLGLSWGFGTKEFWTGLDSLVQPLYISLFREKLSYIFT